MSLCFPCKSEKIEQLKIPPTALPTPDGSTPDRRDSVTRTIPLSRDLVTTVDDEDYAELSQWKWHVAGDADYIRVIRTVSVPNRNRRSGYAHITVGMSRQILKLPKGDPRQVDHINRNTLDNRRSNLRIATPSQNSCNRGLRADNNSGVTGVSWRKTERKWVVRIQARGQCIRVGQFEDFEQARQARLQAESFYFGNPHKEDEL